MKRGEVTCVIRDVCGGARVEDPVHTVLGQTQQAVGLLEKGDMIPARSAEREGGRARLLRGWARVHQRLGL